MKNLYLLLIVSLLAACNTSVSNKDTESDQGSDTLSFKEVMQEYESMYDSDLIIDKVYENGETDLNVILWHHCLFDSMLIPADYHWGENPESYIAHGFMSELTIIAAEQDTTWVTIDKTWFESELSPELREFGALLYPSIKGFDPEFKSLTVEYSISVPGTDIGQAFSSTIKLQQ